MSDVRALMGRERDSGKGNGLNKGDCLHAGLIAGNGLRMRLVNNLLSNGFGDEEEVFSSSSHILGRGGRSG